MLIFKSLIGLLDKIYIIIFDNITFKNLHFVNVFLYNWNDYSFFFLFYILNKYKFCSFKKRKIEEFFYNNRKFY